MRDLLGDRHFCGKMLRIAMPIAAQNLIASSLTLVDTVFIAGLGPTAVAAVGLANQVFFLFNLFLFGVCSGASIFTAQFWGDRDVPNIRRVLGICLLSGTAAALFFFVLALFFPGPVLRIYTRDGAVIAAGSRFLRIIAWSYVLTAVTFSYSFALRAVGRPVYPMIVSFLAFGLNTILNYLLIYGRAGLPRMGVAGSAAATLTARTVEVLATLGLVYGRRLVPAARLGELLSFSRSFVRCFYRTTLPVICNESLWALGVTMFAVVYGRMGTEVIAAFNIYSTVEKLAMVLFFGLAQACAVMVGERIGAGEEGTAFRYARRFAVLGPVLGVFIGAATLAAGPAALGLFRVTGAVTALARLFMTVFALTIPIRIFNLINIVGIMRSGGDTRFSLFIDTAGLWLVAVPLSFLAGLVWRLAPIWVFALAALDEVIKFVVGIWRLVSGRWIHNLVRQMRGGEGTEAARASAGG
ncbi:MAG: MATE family efflux transporter [Bacteroidota bacterium]